MPAASQHSTAISWLNPQRWKPGVVLKFHLSHDPSYPSLRRSCWCDPLNISEICLLFSIFSIINLVQIHIISYLDHCCKLLMGRPTFFLDSCKPFSPSTVKCESSWNRNLIISLVCLTSHNASDCYLSKGNPFGLIQEAVSERSLPTFLSSFASYVYLLPVLTFSAFSCLNMTYCVFLLRLCTCNSSFLEHSAIFFSN